MTTIQVEEIVKSQKTILNELWQIKAKMQLLGSLRRFDEVSKKGRVFARAKGITLKDVLEDD